MSGEELILMAMYCDNLKQYLQEGLRLLCEDYKIPTPPLILTHERYYCSDGWYEEGMMIDIKANDYLGTLLHEFGHYIGMDEVQVQDFVSENREKFQLMFNSNVVT